MQTQAYFDNIQSYVLREIDNATHSILIVGPTITDPEIFTALCRKSQENVKVELLLDNKRSTTRNGLDYEEMRNLGASVIFVGNGNRDKAQISKRFCVIDGEVLMAGSYSWASPDNQLDENITIAIDASELAELFIVEFRAMRERWERKANENTIDHGKLVARLEALRGVIHADDYDDIAQQLLKLKNLTAGKEEVRAVSEIISLLDNQKLDDAETLIMTYLNTGKQVAVYVDPELGELKIELKAIEIQIGSLENEKHEIERTLHSYQYRHTIELGELMRGILHLSKEILRKEAELHPEKEAEYEEAQREFDEFEEDFRASSEKKVADLSPEEQQEIKAMFRASTKLCHPDVVADEHKEDAAGVFNKLAEAYEYNDMETVREVYENLQNGVFAAASDTLNDVQRLHRSLVTMRAKLSNLAKEIRLLRNSEVYREVAAIDDWDEYFAMAKEQMQEELDRLKGFFNEN